MSNPSRNPFGKIPRKKPCSNRSQSGTARRQAKLPKKSCFSSVVQNVQPITTESLGIVGVEVLDGIPEKARFLAGPFYPDELDRLREMVKSTRPRSGVVVAPSIYPDAWAIYIKL
jgi:hypothetical protein